MRKSRQNLLRMLSLLLFVQFLGGCWDVKDINRRALPVALGIELGEDNEFKVYLKIPSIRKEENDYIVMRQSATSLSKAIDRMATNLDRSMELLHVKIILVGESLAKRGLKDVIDFCMRTREIGSKSYMAVVQGDVGEFLEHRFKGESIGSSYNNFFSPSAGWTPEIPVVFLYQAFRGLHSYTEDVVLPVLNVGQQTMLALKGGALMKKGKMLALLSPTETQVYNIYRGLFQGGVVEAIDHGTVRILNVKVSQHASHQNGKPVLKSRLKLDVTILERYQEATDQQLIKDVQEIVKRRFLQVNKLCLKYHADILGVGQKFRRTYSPADLKSWKDGQFPKLQLVIETDVNLRNRGIIR